MRYSIFAAIFFAFCFAKGAVANANHQALSKRLTNLQGDWYGSYGNSLSENLYPLQLTFSTIEGDRLLGQAYLPAYFNTKFNVSAHLRGDSLVIEKVGVVQGHYMGWKGYYTVKVPKRNYTEGVYYNAQGKPLGVLQLTKQNQVPMVTLFTFKEQAKEAAAHFGVTQIEHSPIWPFETIKKEVLLANSAVVVAKTQPYLIEGAMYMSKMEIPIKLTGIGTQRMLFEINVNDKKYMRGTNGTQTWEYDPSMETVRVTEAQPQNYWENGVDLFRDPIGEDLEQGYKILTITNAMVDSIAAHQLVLQKEGVEKVYYTSRTNHLIIKTEAATHEKYRLKHVSRKGLTVPTLYYHIAQGRRDRYVFDHVNTVGQIDLETFEIPDTLRQQTKKTALVGMKDAHYYNKMGNQSFEANAIHESQQYYAQAINIDPTNALYFLNRGIARTELKDYYGAVADFRRSLDLAPSSSDATNRLGLAKYYLGDIEGALFNFEQAIELNRANIDAYHNQGLAYLQQENYEASEKSFALLTALDSTNTKYYYYRGISLAQLNRNVEAVANYDKALQYKSKDASLHNYKGVSLFQMKAYEHAIESFKNAIALDQMDYIKFENLGDAYYKNGNFEEAIEAYQRAKNLNANSSQLSNDLGLSFYQLEMYDLALQYFDSAIVLNSRMANYFDNRALAKTKLMNFTGAIEDYSNSIELYSEDPEAYYRRGLLKVTVNNFLDGCRDFKKAQELGHEYAADMLNNHCVLKTAEN